MNHEKEGNKIIFWSGLIITISLISFFAAFIWQKSDSATPKDEESAKLHKIIERLEEKIEKLENDINQINDSILPSEKIAEVFDIEEPDDKDGCNRIRDNIFSFFSYLNTYNSFTGNKEKDHYALFVETVNQLSENPPEFSDNSAEVLTLLRSMSYFYRTLGKDKIAHFKDTIEKEEDMLEPALLFFYKWLVENRECKITGDPVPSFDMMYRHACFFLNTLAGKSYLIRRNSKVRILTTYYSILIIDNANKNSLNYYGLDIRQPAQLIKDDIINHRKLLYKKNYLARIDEISSKYP